MPTVQIPQVGIPGFVLFTWVHELVLKVHVEQLQDGACAPRYICRSHAKISFYFTPIPSLMPFPLLSPNPTYVLPDPSQTLWPEDPSSCFGLYFVQKSFSKYLLNEWMHASNIQFDRISVLSYMAIALHCVCFKQPKRL